MDDHALEVLLRDLESPSSERKESFADKDRVCQAICAFANDMTSSGRPGYVFIGAKDDGSPAGIPITDELLLSLTALRSDGRILPQPRMVVEKRVLLGVPMAVVEVHPADLPPVRYKGVVWIRVGPRRDRANEAEERALSERRANVAGRTWDARPCDEASPDDLALDLFATYRSYAVAREVVDENRRTVDAIIHRDYESNTPAVVSIFSDRMEIQNPGSLYGDARLEDFRASPRRESRVARDGQHLHVPSRSAARSRVRSNAGSRPTARAHVRA